jgi:hypothetical protein
MARKSAKKKKSAKKAKATVHVAMHRLAKIARVADKAGVGKELKKTLGKNKETVFVQMDRDRFQNLKSFVAPHPSLAKHLDDCDCDENDPFCVCT